MAFFVDSDSVFCRACAKPKTFGKSHNATNSFDQGASDLSVGEFHWRPRLHQWSPSWCPYLCGCGSPPDGGWGGKRRAVFLKFSMGLGLLANQKNISPFLHQLHQLVKRGPWDIVPHELDLYRMLLRSASLAGALPPCQDPGFGNPGAQPPGSCRPRIGSYGGSGGRVMRLLTPEVKCSCKAHLRESCQPKLTTRTIPSKQIIQNSRSRKRSHVPKQQQQRQTPSSAKKKVWYGTFLSGTSNLVQLEPWGTWTFQRTPLCGTLGNLNFEEWNQWNLYVEPRRTCIWGGTFMWNLGEPGAGFRAAAPNHPDALLEEPRAFQAVGEISPCENPNSCIELWHLQMSKVLRKRNPNIRTKASCGTLI